MSSGRFRRLGPMAPCPGRSSCARGQDPGAAAARSPRSPQVGMSIAVIDRLRSSSAPG
jgi:hypothetical protein